MYIPSSNSSIPFNNYYFSSAPTVETLHEAIKNKKTVEEISTLISPTNINALHDGKTALHLAISFKEEKPELVRLLVDKGADIEAVSEERKLPLYLAAEQGKLEILQILLEKEAQVDQRSTNSEITALHIAVILGRHDIILKLLQYGADMHAAAQGNPTFFLSALRGNVSIVELLLDKGGASFDEKNKQGLAALHGAAMAGNREVVKKLLSRGAEINALTSGGHTALYVASNEGKENVVEFLLKRGADADKECGSQGWTALHNACVKGNLELVKKLLHYKKELVKALTKDDKTALYLAAEAGSADIVELLLENGAEINACTKEGITAICVAARKEKAAVVKLLLEKGASLDQKGQVTEWTAIHHACEVGNTEIIKLILSKHAEMINACTKDLRTPLYIAVDKGQKDAVALLLESGASVDQKCYDGWTPLHSASIEGRSEIVEMLLLKGANIDELTKEKTTALHMACEYGYEAVVAVLLERGADVHKKYKGDRTVLHVACERGDMENVKKLLAKGAEVNAKTKGGETPLYLAVKKEATAVISVLLENGASINEKNGEREETALHLAVTEQSDIVGFLLSHGADIHALNKGLKTPFDFFLSLCVTFSDKPDEENQGELFQPITENHYRIFQMLLESEKKRIEKLIDQFPKQINDKEFPLEFFENLKILAGYFQEAEKIVLKRDRKAFLRLLCESSFPHVVPTLLDLKFWEFVKSFPFEDMKLPELEKIDEAFKSLKFLYAAILSKTAASIFYTQNTQPVKATVKLAIERNRSRANNRDQHNIAKRESDFDEADVYVLLSELGVGRPETGQYDALESYSILLGCEAEELNALGLSTGSDLRKRGADFTLLILIEAIDGAANGAAREILWNAVLAKLETMLSKNQELESNKVALINEVTDVLKSGNITPDIAAKLREFNKRFSLEKLRDYIAQEGEHASKKMKFK